MNITLFSMLTKKMKSKLNETELIMLDYFFTVFRDELNIIQKCEKSNDNVRAFNLAFLAVVGLQYFCGQTGKKKNYRTYSHIKKG
jgi:hypothetical protein